MEEIIELLKIAKEKYNVDVYFICEQNKQVAIMDSKYEMYLCKGLSLDELRTHLNS